MEDMVGDSDSLHSCSDLGFFLAFSMVLFYFGAAPLVFFRLTYTPPDVSKRNDITTIVHFANPVLRLPFARAQLCCGVPKSKNITSKLAFKPHRRRAHSARSWSHGILFCCGLSSWSLSVSSLAVSMSVSMSPMDAEESAHRGGNTIASRHQVSNTLQDNTADHKAGNEPASSQQRIQAPFAAHGRTLPMVQSRWP